MASKDPGSRGNESAGESHHVDYEEAQEIVDESRRAAVETTDECMSRSLTELSDAFRSSARRWELIVYPSLVAFIILAVYGFFLIYSLTKDVTKVANSMDSITHNMAAVAGTMDSVANEMRLVSQRMEIVAANVQVQSKVMGEMKAHVGSMDNSMQQMNYTVEQMRYHFAVMNRSISRPMSFMNSFMPW